jgi:hypothetical protein
MPQTFNHPVFQSMRIVSMTALVLAVASRQAEAQRPVIRDSAGIRVVQNPARASAPVIYRLGAAPVMDVGGLEDKVEDEFNANQGYLRAVRLTGKGLAAIDVVRVHIFDAAGKRSTITGRSGAGPGEFRYITSICRTRGDTIVVNDSRNARFGVLDGKGAFVRTVIEGELGSPPFDGCFDDGTLLMRRAIYSAPGAPSKAHLTRVRLDGSVVSVIGDFDMPPFDMVTGNEPTILAAGQRVYIADGYNGIKIYSTSGKLLSIIRTADPLLKISAADVEAQMRGSIPRNTPPGEVADRMAHMRSQPHASAWPAHRRVHVDAIGNLWVQDYVTKYPAPDTWTQFDGEGRIVGRLVIPPPDKPDEPRMNVIAFGVNEIMLRRQDEDGAAHLTIYPIQKIQR